MLRSNEAAEELGIRLMLVHAKHDAASRWYKRFGFEESPTDPLHLILLMKDLRALLSLGGAALFDVDAGDRAGDDQALDL